MNNGRIEFKQQCELNLNYNLEDKSINENFESFISKLNNILNKTLPKSKTGILKQKTPKFWWNNDCSLAIKIREKHRRNYKAEKTPLKYELWKNARQRG